MLNILEIFIAESVIFTAADESIFPSKAQSGGTEHDSRDDSIAD